MITLRQLGPGDAAVMEALLDTFAEAFDDPRSYCDQRPDRAYLVKLLGSETFIAIAAMEGSSVIGGLAAYELRKFEQPRSEIYIYDLAVSAAHRRQGVATALIERLQEIAARHGASVIFVQADTGPEDAAAIALYSKLGSRESVLHFDIPVPAERRRRR